MLRGNFKLQDMEQGKVHKQPAIPFVPKEESAEELDKVEITLQFKLGNPAELINWRIWLNHVIWNKPCKSHKSWFDMVEMLLGGKALQHWQQFKSQAMGLLILMRMMKRVAERTKMTKKKRKI
eukprot:1929278-Ditylum_brightwellii.AAC.1